MKRLTKQLESRLMTAIEKAASLTNGGLDPNEAIVKAAQEHQIPAGSVHLMVHAYNTGRTTRQRRDGSDVWDKAAEFDLADQAKVVEMLYPDRVKTSAAIAEETAISADYSCSPAGLLERREQREKAAHTVDWRTGFIESAPPPLPRDQNHQMRKASSDVDRANRAAEDARRQSTAAFYKAAGTFNELADYFRRPGCTPIPIVREQVTFMHGKRATQIIDNVMDLNPGIAKMAMHQQPVPPHLPPAVGKPYELVTRLLDELSTHADLEIAHVKSAADAQQQAEVLLAPFVQPAVSDSILSDRFSAKRAGAGFGAGLLAKDVLNTVATHAKLPDPTPQVNKNLAALTDPEHEGELRKIRVQSMLQDLMLNDPIIGEHDPEDAAMAYNEIVQSAPHLADQKLVMQSLLRKRLTQGAMDPFDLSQMLSMEGQRRSNEQLTPAAAPKGSPSVAA
jgi:hypothetical protein